MRLPSDDHLGNAIAHRLSTIRGTDQILTFRDRRIIERGTHEDLLEEEGTYATLWRIQAGELDGLPLGLPSDREASDSTD